ncbi:lysylphosphatidylglycerol synthase transmembrane domain-containing protein, partial [Halobium palmae]
MSEANASVDRKTIAKALLGFVLAGIVLYLFGRVIGWNEILRALGSAKLAWVAAACASSALCLLVWSRSWDVILDLLGVEIPWRSLVPTYFAATFADYVTPFGKAGGSPFIAYVLSTDDRANYQESLAGVVTADLLNLLPFFTFAGVGFVALVVQNRVPQGARGLIVGLAILAVAMPLLLYLSYRKRDFVEGLVVKAVGPIAKRTGRVDAEGIRGRVDGFYDRIDVISGHPRTIAQTLVYAFVGWVLFAAPLYLSGRALGVTIDPLIVLFIVPASTLAGITPTPGGLGGVEAAIVGLL